MSWSLASLVLLAAALAVGFAWYERSRPPAKVVALVATLAALAALGRIAFAPLPNVKPTTDIILISGFALGGAPGFAIGALAALSSNLFFGQGPWTPWQMLGWGGVGVAGALLARLTRGRAPGRVRLALVCALAGLGFGVVMNLSTWLTFSGDPTTAKYLAISGAALPFDLAHAIGNAVFCLAFGPALLRGLTRFRRRFEVSWRPAPAVATGLGLALALALGLAAALAVAPTAGAASPGRYLATAQNGDGGWGAAPGQRSTQLHTGWAALGMAAAGHNPRDVRRNGRSVIDFIRGGLPTPNDTGELERTILVVRAAGLSARAFGGRDLRAALLRRRSRNGSIDHQVNLTAFGILSLRAAGDGPSSPPVRAAVRWLARQQDHDGGFNFAGRGGPSGIDDTAGPLQALVASGRRRGRVVARAIAFLRRSQNRDGGFPLTPGGPSNAQSTAWAVQALVVVGRNPGRVRRGGRSALGYLRSLTAPDGSVRYSRTSGQTPVWVTGQALTALHRKPFPLAPVRRARGAAAGKAAVAKAATATRASARARTRGGGIPAATASQRAPAAWLAIAHDAGLITGLLAAPVG